MTHLIALDHETSDDSSLSAPHVMCVILMSCVHASCHVCMRQLRQLVSLAHGQLTQKSSHKRAHTRELTQESSHKRAHTQKSSHAQLSLSHKTLTHNSLNQSTFSRDPLYVHPLYVHTLYVHPLYVRQRARNVRKRER